MITLKDFMETCDYRITEGSAYGWQCFGPNAYRLDSWNQEQDGHTVSIVFDTVTHEVYEVEAFDYKRGRAYRMINPAYREAFESEVEDRDVLDMAWEDDAGEPVKYVDIDVEADFMEKAQAICNDQEYDTRVQIQVNFTDEELLQYMTLAHERDITFNQLVEEAVKAAIDQHRMLNDRQGPVVQSPPFPADSFTQEQAREAVKKTKKKKDK